MLRGLNTPVAIILSEISENYWNNIIHVQSYKILFPNCLLYISLPCSPSIKIKNNFYMNQIIKLHTIVPQKWLIVGTLWFTIKNTIKKYLNVKGSHYNYS